ncbi:MAG: flagellar cap protein FliD N-terminal domain-containing protein, partial [Oceanospirillum sp.]|nr:flagellar cap protein FliD N-terminal domain-containing protein [Oceanospirillum sp.]
MNFLGIGSGLDLSTMLDGLVRVASEPKVQQLGRREIQLEESLSGLGILKSKLSDFQSAADALKDAGLYTAMTPTLTQPASGDLIKVEAGSNAVASNYDIEVVSLASGSKAMSDWRSVKYQSDIMTSDSVSKTDPQNISGDLTFEFGGGAVNITIDAADSLNAIKDKIDAISGVSAKVTDDGRLVYNLDDSTQTLAVHGSDDSLRGLENVAAYQTSAFADTTVDMGLAGNLSFDLGG